MTLISFPPCIKVQYINYLLIDFKQVYGSIKGEALYNILTEFGIPKKLVRLIKMCLCETYSRVRVGRFLSDAFQFIVDLNKEMHYHLYFLTLLWNMPLVEFKKIE